MNGQAHYARARMLGLWYDSATHAYRDRSPGGQKYKYTGSIDANTLEPLPIGEAMRR